MPPILAIVFQLRVVTPGPNSFSRKAISSLVPHPGESVMALSTSPGVIWTSLRSASRFPGRALVPLLTGCERNVM